MNDLKVQDDNTKKPLKRQYKLFYLLFATNLIINLDHGIIPAASLPIEETLNISNEELGLLGSLVYAGIVTLGVLAGPIFMRYKAKLIILMSIVAMMGSLFLFTIQYGRTYPFFILRYLTGISQAPLLVYFPVWVDNFGCREKTIWLTLLQGGVPFGVFTGYVLSSVISTSFNWQWSFYLQICVLFPCLVCFIFVRDRDIEVKDKLRSRAVVLDEVATSKDDVKSVSYHKVSYWQLLKILMKSKIYVCVMLAMGILFFTVTGIQFWISNYMEIVLKVPQKKVNTVFSIVSITAPTFGCILGGIFTQCLGGYESRYAIPFCFVSGLIGALAGLPIPFIDNFWIISACVWLLLFFGGGIVPGLTGIMITSVQKEYRSFANSNTTTFINLFGYLPAPFVYGYLTKINDRAGITFLMIYPSLAIVFLGCAMIIQLKQNRRLDHKEKQALLDSNQGISVTALESSPDNGEFVPLQNQKRKASSATLKNQTEDPLEEQLISKRSIDDHGICEQVFEYHTVLINPTVIANLVSENLAQFVAQTNSIDQNENENENEEDEDNNSIVDQNGTQ